MFVSVDSSIRSFPPDSSEWKCLVWLTTRGQCLWWWRSWSTTSRCTASTLKEYTGSLAPPTKSRNSSRDLTQVTFDLHISYQVKDSHWLCVYWVFLFSCSPYRCWQHESGRLQHPCYCECFQAVAERSSQSSDDVWAVRGVYTCHG